MIEFKVNKNNLNIVEVWCDTNLPVEKPVLTFIREESGPYVAELVQMRLQERLGDMLEATRAVYYDRGYRDGKCHRTKRIWFSRFWS